MNKKYKKRTIKKVKIKIYSFIFMICAGLLLVVFSEFGLKELFQIKNKQQSINAQIQKLLKQQIALQEEIHQLTYDTSYVEQIAREKFMMVQPGEKVFRVIESKSAQ